MPPEIRAYESQPFVIEDPDEPERIVRGVIDMPAGAAGAETPLPAVVVFHGFKGFFRWGFFPELARRIVTAGYPVVRFNFSGSGVGEDLENFTEDESFEHNTPGRELEDARAVLGLLEQPPLQWIDPHRLALVGHSMGSAVALLMAAERAGDTRAVCLWAPVSSFDRFDPEQKAEMRAHGWLAVPNARTGQIHRVGVGWLRDLEAHAAERDPVAACARVRAPVRIVHGAEDESVPRAEPERILAALGPERGELDLVPGGGHTFGARHPLTEVPPPLEQAFEATLEHLRRHLALPGSA